VSAGRCNERAEAVPVVVIMVVLPLVVLALAAGAAFVSLRGSTLRITPDGVEFRNYPQASRTVPLSQVARFEESQAVGNFSSLRPATAVLVLTDGTRLAVRALSAPDAGSGVAALNARVEALRRAG
jgi:hypothetical protein